jgi:hypothetical protein
MPAAKGSARTPLGPIHSDQNEGSVIRENAQKEYSCKLCDLVFERKQPFKVHMQEKHMRDF